MAISFDNIPGNLRTPGFYIEFNNELAGASSQNFKTCAFGQRLSSGTKKAGELVRVNNPQQAIKYFGAGSHLSSIASAYLNNNPTVELWCVALDDNTSGAQAKGAIKVAGTALQAGTLSLLVAGELVQVGVAKGDNASALATKINSTINTKTLAASSAVNATDKTKVDLTARHKGECGNDVVIVSNYFDNQETPVGISLTITQLSGGSANPDIRKAISAMGDEWFNWFVMPYNDSVNIKILTSELDRRFLPTTAQGARAFGATRGNHAAAATFGNALNSPHLSFMAANETPQPAYVWAAANAAVASKSLSIDPARPLQTLILNGLLPAKRERLWTQTERNQLLFDGMATHKVTSDGRVQIERQITTYQNNASGLPDASYLDIQTPETLERIRFKQRSAASQRYPRHKRADDDFPLIPGQAIVRPKDMRAFLLELYRQMMDLGWVEDFENYESTLIVENDSNDASRMNINDQPNLVNQFRVHAQKTQFIL